MSQKIFVVIPFYNGREYIPDCFDSLNKQTIVPEKIIVIDNNSTDGSQELLVNFQFPISPPSPKWLRRPSNFQLILNDVNLGFVGAANQGIKEAINQGADFVFLLNQDTLCDQKCLENLLAVEQSQVNIFAVQALLLCWPQKNLIQTSGDRIHFLGFGYSGDFKQPADLYKNIQFKNITYASGAAMFINVEALKKVGLFDQDLFMYHDDLDLCWRARFLGYQIILAAQAIVYHKYTEKLIKSRWYWSERNRTLTLLKFYKWQTLVLIFPVWLVMELGVLLYSLLTGWFVLKIKSYGTALKLLPQTIRKRVKTQLSRQVSDRQIAKTLDGQFNFAGFGHPVLKYLINLIFGLYWFLVRQMIFW